MMILGVREKLSRAQRKKLRETPPKWTDMPLEWKADVVFLRLENDDLVAMRFRRTDGSDISVGPGSHVSGVWQVRRTEKGTKRL